MNEDSDTSDEMHVEEFILATASVRKKSGLVHDNMDLVVMACRAISCLRRGYELYDMKQMNVVDSELFIEMQDAKRKLEAFADEHCVEKNDLSSE